MHRCIGTGKELSSIRHQDITWNIADSLSIASLGTNFSEILIRIQSFSFKNMLVWYVMEAKCLWPYFEGIEQTVSVPEYAITLCLLMRPATQPHSWAVSSIFAIPTSQGMPTNMIEISHLLLIASTECVQYGFCRRMLPSAVGALVISGTACQIYCYARYCITQLVSPTVPENPSGPLVDYFSVLTCAAYVSQLCGLLPGVDRWNKWLPKPMLTHIHVAIWRH